MGDDETKRLPTSPVRLASPPLTKKPFIIGVAGGTASGKTSVCRKIMESLGKTNCSYERKVIIINQDSFYRDLDIEKRALAARNEYDFDHPDAFDNELMKSTLKDIDKGLRVDLPVYDFKTHTRSKTEKKIVYPADVVLFEGILVLYDREMRDLMEMKLFVDSDSDTRLARRVLRDIRERGRTLDSVLEQYTTFVKPAFEEFCLPVSY
jgi:uridine kinase